MLVKQTLLYLPAQLFSPLFQLITVLVCTYVIDERSLGVVTLVTAVQELLQTTCVSWWSQFVLRFFGRFGSADVKRFYRTEGLVLLAATAIQGAIACLILLTMIEPHADGMLIVAVLAYVVSRSLNFYISERARGRHEVGIYSIQQIGGPALGLACGLFLITFVDRTPQWLLFGYAIAQVAAIIVVLPRILHAQLLSPPDRGLLREALRYGGPIVVASALAWVALNASRFAVNELMGVEAAGLFAVGYGLGQRAASVAAMLVSAGAFPIAVQHMEQSGWRRAMRQLGDNGALLAAVLLPSVAGIVELRSEFVHLLVAKPFQDATLAVLPVSALAGAMRNFRAHFGDQVFLLQKKTRLSVIVTGVEAALTVLLSLAFTAAWGLTGAAYASLVATFVAAAVSFGVGFAYFQARWPYGHFVRIALATAAMMVFLHFRSSGVGYLGLALEVAGGAAVYFTVLAVLYAGELSAIARRPGLNRSQG
jgi:O-antigen/teichoic acid export membrane protein